MRRSKQKRKSRRGKKRLKEGEKLVYDLPSSLRKAEDFIFGQIFLDTITKKCMNTLDLK